MGESNTTSDTNKKSGRWTDLFSFPNVVVHAHLLPNGKVLHFGRRRDPKKDPRSKDPKVSALNEHFTDSFIWTPSSGQPSNGKLGKSEPIAAENQPFWTPSADANEDEKKDLRVNLFCSGHCHLPNGNVFVAGGHFVDGWGVAQAAVFDWTTSKWIAQPNMNAGRWYPSVISLADGRVLVLSGGRRGDGSINNIPQIYNPGNSNTGTWTNAQAFDPNGSVFMAGPKPASWSFQVKEATDAEIISGGIVGRWFDNKTQRVNKLRDYAPSVMYAPGKIMYIGGGTDKEDNKPENMPSSVTEFIDLNVKQPSWDTSVVNMNFPRKQFNATILPDGSVLVNGGSSGPGFNNFKQPVLESELMRNPSAGLGKWEVVAKEQKSRCYHSIALLLPDGRVLSAGGGEYDKCGPEECHTDGQLYEPPYCFQPRPTIVSAPQVIEHGKDYDVTAGNGDKIAKVSLLRLGSVTHTRNMSQSIVFPTIGPTGGSQFKMTAPANGNIAPPGYYMLFVLNEANVPSVSTMVQVIQSQVKKTTGLARMANTTGAAMVPEARQLTLTDHNEKIIAEQDRPHVAVGLTPLCPYGLGPCWGGAYDGLRAITDISVVRPVPEQDHCLAYVYLKEEKLPDIDIWRTEFEEVTNKSYVMRGIEITISGTVNRENVDNSERLVMTSESTDSLVNLTPFQQSSQLKWDKNQDAPKPITDEEASAYHRLTAKVGDMDGAVDVQVTGTLQKLGYNEYALHVREFAVSDP